MIWLAVLLALAALAVYVAMLRGPLRRIEADAKGLEPFDLRRRGYSPAEARAFLAALTDAGRALYLGRQRLLDGVFLVLVTASLLAFIFAGWETPWNLLFSAIALAYGLLDASENMLVARMLRAGAAGVSDAQVNTASRVTRAKFAAFYLSLAAAVPGFLA